MAFVITIAQQKGGAGKTTLVASLAGHWAARRRVALLDIDPQRSLTRWHGLRDRNLAPVRLSEVSGWRLSAELDRLRADCDIVLIDRIDVSMSPRSGDPAAAVVLVAQPGHVSGVIVDGKVRKRNGRLVDVDVDRLQKLAQASHDRLIEAAKLPAQN